jgi:hypothetical protein
MSLRFFPPNKRDNLQLGDSSDPKYPLLPYGIQHPDIGPFFAKGE